MKIEEFLALVSSQRAVIAKEPKNLTKDPIWLVQFKTAIEKRNPLAVFFSQDLMKEYWNVIK